MNSSSTNVFQSNTSQQKKRPTPNHDSILEAFRDLGGGVKNTIANDVVGKTASDALSSLFGQMPKPQSEYRPKNPFERSPFPGFKKETPAPIHRPEILSPARISEEQQRVKQQLESIRAELGMLAKSMGKLNTEIEKAIMETPVDPGVYHVNFLERLKSLLQMIRKRVDSSNEWLQLSGNRKKQKGYWGKYKKHGTQFGLSADRTPATQTG